jgi:preprotein translocase subunit SecD
MTQTKKLVVALALFLLIFINLGVLAYAAFPLIRIFQGKAVRLGCKLVPDPGATVSAADIEKAMEVIRARLNRLGVTSATVERSPTQGEDFAVTLPSVNEPERLKAVIHYYGLLELKPVAPGTQVPYAAREGAEKAAKEAGNEAFEVLKYVQRYDSDSVAQEGFVVIARKAIVTGSDMREATALASQYNSTNYEIAFSLTPEGALRMAAWTGQHVGEHLAIVLNGEVKSAPVINSQIHDRAQITGGFTRGSAEDLAIALNSGTLPHKLEFVSEQLISSKQLAQTPLIKTALFAVSLVTLVVGFIGVVSRRASNSRTGG